MTITRGIAKRLRAVLEDVRDGARADEVEALFLLQKLEPRKAPKKTTVTRKQEKRAARELTGYERRRLRIGIEQRDGGCSVTAEHLCCGPFEWDHQWGRGKAPETLQNGRLMCRNAHSLKTDSRPTRLFWLFDFRTHASKHGYAEELLKTDRAIAQEMGQHPEAA